MPSPIELGMTVNLAGGPVAVDLRAIVKIMKLLTFLNRF
jgi:hypothetical protein